MPHITVVGSLNIDRIAKVGELPRPGETVMASQFVQRFGGKGANQALAARRCGVNTTLIGCVGDDADGHSYLTHLRACAIDTSGVSIKPKQSTGSGLIAVNGRGDNQIIGALGANLMLTLSAIRQKRAVIGSAKVLLIQLEVPLTVVVEAISIAEKANVPIVLNPSPWRNDFPWSSCPIDFVIVNESEAEKLLGFRPRLASGKIGRNLRDRLRSLRIRNLIVTRGRRPTLCFTEKLGVVEPTLQVVPVDTVGAGDAFAGTFAAALVLGKSLPEAVRRANCAGAISTLKVGAQDALPTMRQIERAANKAGFHLET